MRAKRCETKRGTDLWRNSGTDSAEPRGKELEGTRHDATCSESLGLGKCAQNAGLSAPLGRSDGLVDKLVVSHLVYWLGLPLWCLMLFESQFQQSPHECGRLSTRRSATAASTSSSLRRAPESSILGEDGHAARCEMRGCATAEGAEAATHFA